VKGYLRLSSAQMELEMFDDAETTLKAVLALDNNNEIALRQAKTIKQKKEALVKAKKTKKAAKQLDEAQMKEVNLCYFSLI
jgi:hypothetical protein